MRVRQPRLASLEFGGHAASEEKMMVAKPGSAMGNAFYAPLSAAS